MRINLGLFWRQRTFSSKIVDLNKKPPARRQAVSQLSNNRSCYGCVDVPPVLGEAGAVLFGAAGVMGAGAGA
jgi:hypothetical protein